jgi:hypothetical protein
MCRGALGQRVGSERTPDQHDRLAGTGRGQQVRAVHISARSLPACCLRARATLVVPGRLAHVDQLGEFWN